MSSQELHQYSGFRKFLDFSVFEKIRSRMHFVDSGSPPVELADFATIPRGDRGKRRRRSKCFLQDVYMDIGYSDGVAPKGYNSLSCVSR
jgi:hypothetical protein